MVQRNRQHHCTLFQKKGYILQLKLSNNILNNHNGISIILFILKLSFKRKTKAEIGHATVLEMSLHKTNFYAPSNHD